MVRTSLALLTVLALMPSPAGAAACGLLDPAGDAAVADDHVMGGAYEVPAPLKSLDVVEARVVASGHNHVFTMKVVDLAAAAAEAPAGAAYYWDVETASRGVYAFAWRNAAGQGGVELYAGRDVQSAAHVASYGPAVFDDAADTVTFRIPAGTLAAHGLRPGARVTTTVATTRGVAVAGPDRLYMQSLQTDSATGSARPWSRC